MEMILALKQKSHIVYVCMGKKHTTQYYLANYTIISVYHSKQLASSTVTV